MEMILDLFLEKTGIQDLAQRIIGDRRKKIKNVVMLLKNRFQGKSEKTE
jgi:hypothetical protein